MAGWLIDAVLAELGRGQVDRSIICIEPCIFLLTGGRECGTVEMLARTAPGNCGVSDMIKHPQIWIEGTELKLQFPSPVGDKAHTVSIRMDHRLQGELTWPGQLERILLARASASGAHDFTINHETSPTQALVEAWLKANPERVKPQISAEEKAEAEALLEELGL